MLNEGQAKILRKSLRKINRKLGVLKKDPFNINLSLSQCHALVEIEEKGPLSASDLVFSLNLEKSTISRLVNQLIEQRLIITTTDGKDGRKKILRLTPEGRKKLEIINRLSNSSVASLFDNFSQKQLQKIIETFSMLAESS